MSVHTTVKFQVADQQDAPKHYIEALESFLKTNPMDIHFIMELGREGQSVGGNGFGSVTCGFEFPFLPSYTDGTGMEDYCWEVR